ncbi:hypothetical protein [Haloactinopolyspora sp.]|jgi:hypothetical protein|uniref:hypothetical protein n=1 Tax=Haloactinopolyspora sp. TaxID=1966353 RepID=UPI00260E4E3B|nr:hypothetical protein [Haloactinopolyspora sp.]
MDSKLNNHLAALLWLGCVMLSLGLVLLLAGVNEGPGLYDDGAGDGLIGRGRPGLARDDPAGRLARRRCRLLADPQPPQERSAGLVLGDEPRAVTRREDAP